MNKVENDLLVKHHYLVELEEDKDSVNYEYLNTYLLINFGIIVDDPKKLRLQHINFLDTYLQLEVPASFYNNPQDTKYYTKHELLVEQALSYFAAGFAGIYDRIEIFKKELPEYSVGDEFVLRNFKIISNEKAKIIVQEIFNDYCSYTRPFSIKESEDFYELFKDYYVDQDIKCKDNIFLVLENNPRLATKLDKKDLVKLSIKLFGDYKDFNYEAENYEDKLASLTKYIPLVKDCPLSKKQAKYFNKLRKLCDVKIPKVSNKNSTYRKANECIKKGDILKAAKVFESDGSLLERNLVYLLSRTNLINANEILKLVPEKNPIVLYQLVTNLVTNAPRVFTFIKNNKVVTYHESTKEFEYRKSKLDSQKASYLRNTLLAKLYNYYSNKPKLGKVYIDKDFYKLALPVNTSAGGQGVDTIPSGSRKKIMKDKIRTFVHWKKAFDIDSSLYIEKEDNSSYPLYWSNVRKIDSDEGIWFSGDCTGSVGSEYWDLDLTKLRNAGVTRITQTFQGYSSRLNEGEIYTGYMEKDDLNTKAWDPKNITTQFRVQGDTRGCLAFSIDLTTMEIIFINQMFNSESRVIEAKDVSIATKYYESNFLDVNVGKIIEIQGEPVDSPWKANIVLDDHYFNENGNQKVIRTWELEKLVNLIK